MLVLGNTVFGGLVEQRVHNVTVVLGTLFGRLLGLTRSFVVCRPLCVSGGVKQDQQKSSGPLESLISSLTSFKRHRAGAEVESQEANKQDAEEHAREVESNPIWLCTLLTVLLLSRSGGCDLHAHSYILGTNQ